MGYGFFQSLRFMKATLGSSDRFFQSLRFLKTRFAHISGRAER